MASQGQPPRRDRFDEMDDDEMIDMMREMRENDVTSPTSMKTGDDEHEVTMTPAAMSPPEVSNQASIDQVLSALRTMKEEMTEMRERERELREENERLRERETARRLTYSVDDVDEQTKVWKKWTDEEWKEWRERKKKKNEEREKKKNIERVTS